MQLVEAAILFFVGLVAGVLVTVFDIYTVGAAAFFSRVSVWVLLNVLYGANVRDRRTAVLGAIPLNLGFVEMYYLTTTFTYAGMSRSLMVPLALLALVASLVTLLAWTAKNERNAYGLLLSAFVVVATLVSCVVTHGGIATLDVVCVVIMAYVLLFMRSKRFSLTLRQREPEQVPARSARMGEGHVDAPGSHGGDADRLASSPKRRPATRKASKGTGSDDHSRSRRSSGQGTSRRSTQAGRDTAAGRRDTASSDRRRGRGDAASARTSSGRGSTTQRPTKRTGGTVSSARVVRAREGASRVSSSSRRSASGARVSGSTSGRSTRRPR